MGLDACVYCNCFRDGTLKSPPPSHIDVYVMKNGGLECHNKDLETQEEFDAWYNNDACEHEEGDFQSHYLGNISLVGFLRDELSRHPEHFPILLEEVIYSGSHCGDWLEREDVVKMLPELDRLGQFVCDAAENQKFVDEFLIQMRELCEASEQTGNPIAF